MSFGFAKIAGGAPSSVGDLTNHLQNATLTPEEGRLAAYYERGLAQDPTLEIARSIAAGELSLAEGTEILVDREMAQIPEPTFEQQAPFMTWDRDRWVYTRDLNQEREEVRFEIEGRISSRLDVLAERVENGTLDAPLAVIRPDVHPLALQALGVKPGEILSHEAINGLLSGNTAAGERIEGKRYAVAHAQHNPKTGEITDSAPIGSYDFTPQPHKSVSVAWAFASPVERAMIFNAHIEAARETMALRIAPAVGQARYGAGGEEGSEPGHILWVEFTHNTSRRTQAVVNDSGGVTFVDKDRSAAGDPSLHTHMLVPNLVACESGRLGSLDTKAIGGGALFEADAYYNARYGQKLADAGFDVAFDQRTGTVRMTAVSDDLCNIFSKRTNVGEAFARQLAVSRGERWDALSAAEQERRIKNATQHQSQKIKGGKDDKADFEDWKRQAKEAGWEPPASFMRHELRPQLGHEQRIRRAYEIALPFLADKLEHNSVLNHCDVRIAALRGLMHTGCRGLDDVAAVTKLMREEGVTQFGEKTALVWSQEPGRRAVSITTSLHEAQENEFVALAKSAAADKSAALPVGALDVAVRRSGLDFTTEHGKAQLKAMRSLNEGGRFAVVTGVPGSGKSALLRPYVDALRADGREVFGASLAWRQTDDLAGAGIDERNLKAFSVLLDGLGDGSISLNRTSVVAVDEFALLGTRQGLELLRHQAKQGFKIACLADDKQCTSVEAGAIIELARRALGPENIPEILTTVRQQTERERTIVGLFREGEAKQALDMKRSDGTAEMVAGGYDQVVARVAKLYAERLRETGLAPTISTPTNFDTHQIGAAVRLERRTMGLVGEDVTTIKATDGEREYNLALAKGDHLRLFASVGVTFANGKGGRMGRNGKPVEVIEVDSRAMVIRDEAGRTGSVRLAELTQPKRRASSTSRQRPGKPDRAHLAYGTALTINTAQGSTAHEHIVALPSGSQAVDKPDIVVAGSRHRVRSYIVTSDYAEREDIRKRLPLNDTRDINLDAKWANVGKHFVRQPVRDLAIDMVSRAQTLRRGLVRSFQAGLHPPEQRALRGEPLSHGPEKGEPLRVARLPIIRRAMDIARDLPERMRQVMQQRIAHEYRGPSIDL